MEKINNYLKVAEFLEDEKLKQILEKLREVKNSKQYVINIVGEFSSGKSSLINNILKQDILPTGILETTAVNTFFYFSNNKKAFLYYKNGKKKEIRVEEVKNYYIDNINNEVDYIEIFLNSKVLKKGLVIVDTVGINTFVNNNENANINKIPSKIMYVMGKSITNRDKEYIEKIMQTNVDIIFIRTKMDEIKVSEETKEEAIAREKNRINSLFGQKYDIFFVSNLKQRYNWYKEILHLEKYLLNISDNIEKELNKSVQKYLDDIYIQLNKKLSIKISELQKECDSKTNDFKNISEMNKETENNINREIIRREIEVINQTDEIKNTIKQNIDKNIISIKRQSMNKILKLSEEVSSLDINEIFYNQLTTDFQRLKKINFDIIKSVISEFNVNIKNKFEFEVMANISSYIENDELEFEKYFNELLKENNIDEIKNNISLYKSNIDNINKNMLAKSKELDKVRLELEELDIDLENAQNELDTLPKYENIYYSLSKKDLKKLANNDNIMEDKEVPGYVNEYLSLKNKILEKYEKLSIKQYQFMQKVGILESSQKQNEDLLKIQYQNLKKAEIEIDRLNKKLSEEAKRKAIEHRNRELSLQYEKIFDIIYNNIKDDNKSELNDTLDKYINDYCVNLNNSLIELQKNSKLIREKLFNEVSDIKEQLNKYIELQKIL